jgi:flagellar assembly factor FliW
VTATVIATLTPTERQPVHLADAAGEELPELHFPVGLPGFAERRRFALVRVDDSGLLFTLRSLEDPSLRLFVVPPAPFFPDYAPEIDDADAALLELSDASDAQVLLVVTPGASPADATANLLAPIVVNTRARVATQVILTGADLSLRAPLAA